MKEIFNRRSVRKFLDKPLAQEEITALLRAAMRAPSAGNQQPWEFVVLEKRERLLEIVEIHPYAAMLREAPCAIVVCGNKQRQKFPQDFWIQDCSAATQNLLLEAVHLGLGAVWLGVYPLEDRTRGMQTLLGLPEHVLPLCAVALGHPAQQPAPLDTFLAERIHREQWE